MNITVMSDLGWRKIFSVTSESEVLSWHTKILPVFLLDYTTKIGKFRTENSVTTDELSSLSILKVIAYPLKLGILDES